jgi:iron complex outermembrane receptor protein
MMRAPDFTGNLGVSYTVDLAHGELALSSNLSVTSKVYFDSSNNFPQKGYEILSLRAEWTDPSRKYTLAIFGDNLTDSEYRVQGEAGSFGNASVWGYPATVGASIRAKF